MLQPGSGGVIDPSEAFRHMPVTKPLLLIPVENQVRELDPKLRLACIAARRGYSSENQILHGNPGDKNFSKISHVALENKADVIAIYSRAERRKDIADFEGYKTHRNLDA
jgi:hypothetical protein